MLNNEKTQALPNHICLIYFLGPGDEGAQEYDFGNYNTAIFIEREL